jgi:hypothetical protein
MEFRRFKMIVEAPQIWQGASLCAGHERGRTRRDLSSPGAAMDDQTLMPSAPCRIV